MTNVVVLSLTSMLDVYFNNVCIEFVRYGRCFVALLRFRTAFRRKFMFYIFFFFLYIVFTIPFVKENNSKNMEINKIKINY